MVEKRLVVIVGNGLSRACSDAFDVQTLSAKLREALAKPDALGVKGLDIADGLASYLDGPAVDGKPGFEQLVGAFDSLRRSVGLLSKLKEAGSPLANALESGDLKNVEAFCHRVYRKGTSIALTLIDESARTAPRDNPTIDLVKMLKRDIGGHVTYATLNYDTLLLQALMTVLSTGDFADVGCGGEVASIEGTGQREVKALRLTCREKPGAVAKRPVRLLNLHGSVQFWKMEIAGATTNVKVDTTPDERRRHLEAYATDGSVGAVALKRPLVIFGNQRDKSVLVNEHPFNVAYDRLKVDLRDATGVLIIGYGFGDEVLNCAIQESVGMASGLKAAMVVTHGFDLARDHVEELFVGSAVPSPPILREGIGGDAVTKTGEWKAFVTAFKDES